MQSRHPRRTPGRRSTRRWHSILSLGSADVLLTVSDWTCGSCTVSGSDAVAPSSVAVIVAVPPACDAAGMVAVKRATEPEIVADAGTATTFGFELDSRTKIGEFDRVVESNNTSITALDPAVTVGLPLSCVGCGGRTVNATCCVCVVTPFTPFDSCAMTSVTGVVVWISPPSSFTSTEGPVTGIVGLILSVPNGAPVAVMTRFPRSFFTPSGMVRFAMTSIDLPAVIVATDGVTLTTLIGTTGLAIKNVAMVAVPNGVDTASVAELGANDVGTVNTMLVSLAKLGAIVVPPSCTLPRLTLAVLPNVCVIERCWPRTTYVRPRCSVLAGASGAVPVDVCCTTWLGAGGSENVTAPESRPSALSRTSQPDAFCVGAVKITRSAPSEQQLSTRSRNPWGSYAWASVDSVVPANVSAGMPPCRRYFPFTIPMLFEPTIMIRKFGPMSAVTCVPSNVTLGAPSTTNWAGKNRIRSFGGIGLTFVRLVSDEIHSTRALSPRMSLSAATTICVELDVANVLMVSWPEPPYFRG